MSTLKPLNYKFKNKSANRQLLVSKVFSYYDPNPCILCSNIPPLITKTNLKQTFSDNFGSVVKILLKESLDEDDDINFQEIMNKSKLMPENLRPKKSETGLFVTNPFEECQQLVNGYGFAYIFFLEEQSVTKVLNYPFEKHLTIELADPIMAPTKISIPLNTKTSEKINSECDDYLDWYDNEKERQEKLKLELENQGDSDNDNGSDGEGAWIVVGEKEGAKFTEQNEIGMSQKWDKKRKIQNDVNFYSSAKKQARRTKADLIKEQFEKAKMEIKERRKNRKFKPV